MAGDLITGDLVINGHVPVYGVVFWFIGDEYEFATYKSVFVPKEESLVTVQGYSTSPDSPEGAVETRRGTVKDVSYSFRRIDGRDEAWVSVHVKEI